MANYLVNGHIESKWTAETEEWSEPTFVKGSKLGISGLSSALNYGNHARPRYLSVYMPLKIANRFREFDVPQGCKHTRA